MQIQDDFDYTFTHRERDRLREVLQVAPTSPYEDHVTFLAWVDELSSTVQVPSRFVDFCKMSMQRDFATRPITAISNAPIDLELPFFDAKHPVESKYELKKTFVAEAFLALYAKLTTTEIVAHLSVNSGDFFHDIYPKESMFDSQSQKTLGTLKFHRDFTNHFVSPDFVNTLTLRDAPRNEVYSTFCNTATVKASLDDSTLAVLYEKRFYTPFDDVSTNETGISLGRAADHAVLSDIDGARIFEGRTLGLDDEAQHALDAFLQALHANKFARLSRAGDSVTFSNRDVIHGREVKAIHDIESLKQRWLLKTHNVFDLTRYENFFVTGRYGVVNG